MSIATSNQTRFSLLVLPGDGVGPEVCASALEVLDVITRGTGLSFDIETRSVGMACFQRTGVFVEPETIALARRSDAVLFGAEGGPVWDKERERTGRPGALLELRSGLNLYASGRPVQAWPGVVTPGAFRPDAVAETDMVIVRELSAGIYTSRPKETTLTAAGSVAVDTQRYTAKESDRIARLALKMARSTSGPLTSIDKANAMETGRLWRRRVSALAASEFPEVQVQHAYADAVLYDLVREPTRFAVILADNLFGDLVSDCAAVFAGSLGMLPALCVSTDGPLFLEPVHGTASDLEGTNSVNPIGTILCIAMLLEDLCQRRDLALQLRRTVASVVQEGIRTSDLGGAASTTEMIAAITANLSAAYS